MKLTGKQRKELEIIKWFIPANCSFEEITDEDIERFFAWSDRGEGASELRQIIAPLQKQAKMSGLAALYWGKQRRDLQITSYLEDWGATCNAYDFVDEPEVVAEYLAKRLKKPQIMEAWHEHRQPEPQPITQVSPEDQVFVDMVRDSINQHKGLFPRLRQRLSYWFGADSWIRKATR